MTEERHRIPPGLQSTRSVETLRNPAPPDWSESPAAWSKRTGVAALSIVGFCVAVYLTLYQSGSLIGVWDPFFPNGSPAVLRLAGPFPYAILWAIAFGLEAVLCFIGGRERWHTAPWAVISFGILATLTAAASTLLAIAQPLATNNWSTPCLFLAVVSLILLGWESDEVLAALQHVARVREGGGSLRRAFLGRERLDFAQSATRTRPPQLTRLLAAALTLAPRLVGLAFGMWFTMAPEVVGYTRTASGGNDHITGPILAAVSLLAMWPALRSLRWAEIALAAWIFVAPFFIRYDQVNGEYNILPSVLHICTALILFGTAFLGGRVSRSLGGGWSAALPFVKRATRGFREK